MQSGARPHLSNESLAQLQSGAQPHLSNQSLAQLQSGPQTHLPNESLAQLQSATQTHLSAQHLQSFLNASPLVEDKASKEPPNTSPPVSLPPSSFHMSAEEVNSEHKLHVDNTDASSEMKSHFSPNGASVTFSGPGSLDVTSTGQSFSQDVTVDSDGAAYTPWTCCRKVPRPKDCKPCPEMPKAPPSELYTFFIFS